MIKILYCGMYDDIFTPIELVPDFDTIFVIDRCDYISRNFEDVKSDIKTCLITGDDTNSHRRFMRMKYYKNDDIYFIDEPCIINNDDDCDNRWTLNFTFKNKVRNLIYFHHIDLYSMWNNDISDINHLISVGCDFLYEKYVLDNMLRNRCVKDCLFYNELTDLDNTKIINILDRNINVNNVSDILNENENNSIKILTDIGYGVIKK